MTREGHERMGTLARSHAWLLLVAIVLLVTLGCAMPQGPTVHIRGKVYGDDARQQEAGRSVPVPLAATVTCDGVSARTSPDGTFDLVVAAANEYHCTASAPLYTPNTADITQAPAYTDLTLNFGPIAPLVCAPYGRDTDVECPQLHLGVGTLGGTVTYADTSQPAGGVTVRCWNPTGPMEAGTADPSIYTARTSASGAYTLNALPAARYECVAGGDQEPHSASVAPSASATLSFAICGARCPAVTFHGGAVMRTLTVYLIFWLPKPYTYDQTGSPSRYESLITRYFNDVGGTPFYDLLTQYWDYQGAIQNRVTVGGTYVDTRNYPHQGTRADPLLDADIQAEVQQVMQAKQWMGNLEHAFFVFTGYGAEVCNHAPTLICSFATTSKDGFCGYHSFIPSPTAVYAEITDVGYCVGSATDLVYAGPNKDRLADAAIDFVSHEQFEVVSDPMNRGWFAGKPADGEIGDRCETQYGNLQDDGSNMTLHGNPYLVQKEWSDRTNSCAFHL